MCVERRLYSVSVLSGYDLHSKKEEVGLAIHRPYILEGGCGCGCGL